MDDVIFEEFKGHRNMEIYLDPPLDDKQRVFLRLTSALRPRKDDCLLPPDELSRLCVRPKVLSTFRRSRPWSF